MYFKVSMRTNPATGVYSGYNPQITIDELAENIGRITRSIEMQIQKLKKSGKTERIGPDKGGYW